MARHQYKKGEVANPAGRPKGIPNKKTILAREAIAMFVDGNAHRLQDWLDQIANGVPMVDANGLRVVDKAGMPLWSSPPDPTKAFTLFQSVIEYHVPKLGRQEITGPEGGGIVVQIVNLSELGGK